MYRRGSEAYAEQVKTLATLSDREAITLKQLPSLATREMYLSTLAEKFSEAVDYTHPITRGYATQLASKYAGGYNIGQVGAIFDYLFNNWQYVSDPSDQEYIAAASETITVGLRGDCEDFSCLMCSLILAIGGEARVNVAFGEQGGHSFAEVMIGNTEAEATKAINSLRDLWKRDWSHLVQTLVDWFKKINYEVSYTKDSTGIWLCLDWWSAKPGGKYFPAIHRWAIFPKSGEVLTIKG